MVSKPGAIIVLLLSFASTGAARADANDDYNRCADLPDHPASVVCVEKLAQGGNAIAELALAGFYAGGDGVPQDLRQAVYWYQKSAAQGNAAAMSKLGDAYLTGNGVAQDYGQAASWFGRAASAGDPWSLTKLGSLYEAGEGVAQDDVTAYQWYDVAAAKGDAHAAELRDTLAQKMTAAQIAEAKKRSSEWLAQSETQAAAASSAASAKAVADCATAVRSTNASPLYANFQAVYSRATGKIEFTGTEAAGPIAAFDTCMAAKGYNIGATSAQ